MIINFEKFKTQFPLKRAEELVDTKKRDQYIESLYKEKSQKLDIDKMPTEEEWDTVKKQVNILASKMDSQKFNELITHFTEMPSNKTDINILNDIKTSMESIAYYGLSHDKISKKEVIDQLHKYTFDDEFGSASDTRKYLENAIQEITAVEQNIEQIIACQKEKLVTEAILELGEDGKLSHLVDDSRFAPDTKIHTASSLINVIADEYGLNKTSDIQDTFLFSLEENKKAEFTKIINDKMNELCRSQQVTKEVVDNITHHLASQYPKYKSLPQVQDVFKEYVTITLSKKMIDVPTLELYQSIIKQSLRQKIGANRRGVISEAMINNLKDTIASHTVHDKDPNQKLQKINEIDNVIKFNNLKGYALQYLIDKKLPLTIKDNNIDTRIDPVLYCQQRNIRIQGKDAMHYAIDKNLTIDNKPAAQYAVDNKYPLIHGIPVIQYAIDKDLKIGDKPAMQYAVEKNVLIYGQPIIVYPDHILRRVSKPAIQYAIDQDLKIGGKPAVQYAIDHDLMIDDKDALQYTIYHDLKIDNKPSIKYAIDHDLKIDDKPAIQYALDKYFMARDQHRLDVLQRGSPKPVSPSIDGQSLIEYALWNDLKINNQPAAEYLQSKEDKYYRSLSEARTPIEYAIQHGLKINNQPALEYAMKNTKYVIDTVSPVEYALTNNLSINNQPALEYAVKNQYKLRGKPAIQYMVDNNLKVDQKLAIEYAIDRELDIDGKHVVQYAIDKNLIVGKKYALPYAIEKKLDIHGIPAIQYALDKDLKLHINSLPPEPVFKYIKEKRISIDDKSAIHYALDNELKIDNMPALVYAMNNNVNIPNRQPHDHDQLPTLYAIRRNKFNDILTKYYDNRNSNKENWAMQLVTGYLNLQEDKRTLIEEAINHLPDQYKAQVKTDIRQEIVSRVCGYEKNTEKFSRLNDLYNIAHPNNDQLLSYNSVIRKMSEVIHTKKAENSRVRDLIDKFETRKLFAEYALIHGGQELQIETLYDKCDLSLIKWCKDAVKESKNYIIRDYTQLSDFQQSVLSVARVLGPTCYALADYYIGEYNDNKLDELKAKVKNKVDTISEKMRNVAYGCEVESEPKTNKWVNYLEEKSQKAVSGKDRTNSR